jgi:hypothetical protein
MVGVVLPGGATSMFLRLSLRASIRVLRLSLRSASAGFASPRDATPVSGISCIATEMKAVREMRKLFSEYKFILIRHPLSRSHNGFALIKFYFYKSATSCSFFLTFFIFLFSLRREQFSPTFAGVDGVNTAWK